MNYKNESRVVYFVKDFRGACNYYLNILNASLFKEWDHGEELGKGAVFKLGNILIEFLESETELSKSESYLYVEVGDIQKIYSNLKKKVRIVEVIKNQAWGHTNFMIEDCNHIKIKFFQKFSN